MPLVLTALDVRLDEADGDRDGDTEEQHDQGVVELPGLLGGVSSQTLGYIDGTADWQPSNTQGLLISNLLSSLINELLSKRIGLFTSFLEDNHDELSDPATNDDVAMLAMRLDDAVRNRRPIWIQRMEGAEIGTEGRAGYQIERRRKSARAGVFCIMVPDARCVPPFRPTAVLD